MICVIQLDNKKAHRICGKGVVFNYPSTDQIIAYLEDPSNEELSFMKLKYGENLSFLKYHKKLTDLNFTTSQHGYALAKGDDIDFHYRP